jgi:ubiquitin carboxyl-terminal hydrolase 4/11/15
MYLTLPLPVNKKWRHEIYYIPWDTDQIHVKVPVELNRDASFRDLRTLLGRWMGTNPDNVHSHPTFMCLRADFGRLRSS